MKTLQQAIEEITYSTSKFPEEAFKVITANAEEVRPLLHQAIHKAMDEMDNLDEDYMLHFYALFLLAEFKDRSAFGDIIRWVSLPSDVIDYHLGDVVTSGLSDILYLTYDGDLELLMDAVRNSWADDYARSSMLRTMGQLFLDNSHDCEAIKSFWKEIIYSAECDSEYCDPDYIYTALVGIICDCHLVDMLPDIRYMFQQGLVDESVHGRYEDCIDIMFRYSEENNRLCAESLNAAQTLRNWVMFEQDESKHREPDFDKLMKAMLHEQNQAVKTIKVGRNDPCPCGSGKKYKRCCLNQPKTDESMIETVAEQQKWLKHYPPTGVEKQAGKIYLDDFYDVESIEIDRLVYLALMHRPHFIFQPEDETVVANRQRAYLQEAFLKYARKIEKEGITSCKEYDDKYSIHYRCAEWMSQLAHLLKQNGDKKEYKMVVAAYRSS